MIKSLTVIDGLDGSGKATQTQLLCDHLRKNNPDVIKLSFPVYDSQSSALVRMYLDGELSTSPEGVNAYAASTFYAVDRCAHFLKHYQEYDKKVCIADRYTTSNIIYQTAKLPKDKWQDFITWCTDFEYNKLEIPKPNRVIYLDMPTEISQTMMSNRYKGDETKKDLHEANIAFLQKCRTAALYIANELNWTVVHCNNGNEPRAIEDIHNEIIDLVQGEHDDH